MMKATTICWWVTCLFCLAITSSCDREEASEPAPVVEDRSVFGGPTETAPSDWEIVVFAAVNGEYGVIARGGAHLDKQGTVTRLGIAYSLPQGEVRVLVDNGRTYVRNSVRPYVWVDFTDPVGEIPGIPDLTVVADLEDDYVEAQSRTYGNDTFEVFERSNGVFQAEENTAISFKDQYWIDTSGQVRRRIGITTISTKNKGITLVTVADRVVTEAVPDWYYFDNTVNTPSAIPAAATLRAITYRDRRESGSSSNAGELGNVGANIPPPVGSISLRQSSPLSNFLIRESEAQDLPELNDSDSSGTDDTTGLLADDVEAGLEEPMHSDGRSLISGIARLLFPEALAEEHDEESEESEESEDVGEWTSEETEQTEESEDVGEWTTEEIEQTEESEDVDSTPPPGRSDEVQEQLDRLQEQVDEYYGAPGDYSGWDLSGDYLGVLSTSGLGYAIGMVGIAASAPFIVVIGGVVFVAGGLVFGTPLINDFANGIKGIVQGDPHITTLDGHSFDFQATGEFIIVEAPQFQVQQRFEGAKGINTSVRATAIRAGNHVIEFFYTGPFSADDSLSVIVDGSPLEVDREGVNFNDGTYVARRGSGDNDLFVFSPDGSYVRIENLYRAQNVLTALSTDTENKVTGGLTGVPDGDASNDFTLRDGTVMAMSEAQTIEGLYGRFASSWRVRPDERLFTQGKAEDYHTAEYTDLPQSVTKLSDFSESETANARQTCVQAGVDGDVALQDCTYDVLASGGDVGWAKMAASSGTISALAPSAVAAIVEARMPEDSPSGQQFWWTIVNQSTEKKLTRHGDRQFTIDLLPGSYSVTVIAGIFEGEKIIDVQSSVPNEFFVDLWNREIPVLSSPETVSAGEAMVFEWKGALSSDAHIIVVAPDAYKGYYNNYNHHRAIDGSPATLVAPAKPGSFEILYVDDRTETILFRKPLEVTPAKVRFIGPEEVSAGTEFELSWDGPNADGDTIFIAKPNMRSDYEFIWDEHLTRSVVSARSEVPARITAPRSPGTYELRYYSYGNQKMLAKRKLIVR